MFYDTALCNHVLMNGYFSISNSYTLRNVYVPLTTNPNMFYNTTVKNHSLDQHNHVLMNGYVPISYCYTLCNVYVQSTTNPSMFYKTTVKNHSLDQRNHVLMNANWVEDLRSRSPSTYGVTNVITPFDSTLGLS